MKRKSLILLSLISCLFLLLSACSSSNQSKNSSSASKNASNVSKNSSSSPTQSGSSTHKDPNAINSGDPLVLISRMNAVIKATLDVESKTQGTKVDYKMKSMTQNGKKVTFSITPGSKNQADFKQGTIKGLIYDGDNSHNKTFFNYTIDDSNKLSLIDPTTKKVVYTTIIQANKLNQ